jgi:hypothetical protein
MDKDKAEIVIEKCQALATDKGATKGERIVANHKAQTLIDKHINDSNIWIADTIWMPDAWFTRKD